MTSEAIVDEDSSLSGPFSQAAHVLCSFDLTVLPVGGDGKMPLVKWRGWSRRPSSKFIDKLIWRYPEANIGIICHLSDVTVVDIDDPALLEPMLERFGNTPLITRTPGGGFHLWYRHAGERCCNLRGEDLDVDIKGQGGFVVVPPSVARQGRHAGMPYVFERGSWADLGRLRRINEDSLLISGNRQRNDRFRSDQATPLQSIAVGRRNDTLFRHLLRQARHCDTLDDLLDVAFTINDHNLEEPLQPAEVAKIACSAWGYEQRGENWTGQEARATISRSELEILERNPDACVLWTKLKMEHGAHREPFSISPKAMAKNEVIADWRDQRRYRKTRDWLVAEGFIEQVSIGGRAPGDPHLFRLSTPSAIVESRGARNAPNITRHLPPGRSDASFGWFGIEHEAREPENMSDPLTLGRKLRQHRREAGLSQTEVARRAGVSRATVGNLETGRLQLSATTMQRLAAVFHERQERGAA